MNRFLTILYIKINTELNILQTIFYRVMNDIDCRYVYHIDLHQENSVA